ncbi:MAG: septum formation initiator family protein [Chloroflexi bacterium]|nr:MAG: septum formation initiator family protein [Chloroflexota bacterium]
MIYTVSKRQDEKRPVTKKRQGSRASLTQLVLLFLLTMSIFLIFDLARRTAVNYRVQKEAERLEQELAAARAYQAELRARRSYVASDLYVEEIARNELKWALPGETVVVVVAPSRRGPARPRQFETSIPPEPAAEQVQVMTPVEAWWELFFGDPPVQVEPVEMAGKPGDVSQAAAKTP